MAYYNRPHHGGFGFGGHRNWGGHGWGHGWGHGHGFGRGWGHGRGYRYGRGLYHGWGRRWPWLQPDADQSALLPWAQNCLSQLMGPDAVQDIQQAIQQFQSQQQLPATGMLDGNTVTALQAACSGQQAGGQDAGGAQAAPSQPTREIGESEEWQVGGTVLPGQKSWPHSFAPWGSNDDKTLKQEMTKGVQDPNQLADAVFFRRHPELRGTRLPRAKGNPAVENLKSEWNFLLAMVEAKFLGASMDVTPLAGGPTPELDSDYGQEPGAHRHSGRWIRRNGKIVLLGV
jgi:hypothetical protein